MVKFEKKTNLTFDYNSGRYRFIPTGGSNGAVGSLDPPFGPIFFNFMQFFKKKIKSRIRNWCCAWWDSCFKIVIQSESRLHCVNLIDNCTKEMIDSTEMLFYGESHLKRRDWKGVTTGDLFSNKQTKFTLMQTQDDECSNTKTTFTHVFFHSIYNRVFRRDPYSVRSGNFA